MKPNILLSCCIFVSFLILFVLLYSKLTDSEDLAPGKNKHTTSAVVERNALPRYEPSVKQMIDVPESIRLLFKDEEKGNYKVRLKLLSELNRELSTDERDGLYLFLSNDEDSIEALHLKDEVMCKLEQQTTWPPEYIEALTKLFLDDNITGELKGYIIQHIRSAYDREEVDRENIRRVLFVATQDIENDASGTACLALTDLSRKYQDFDRSTVANAVFKVASNKETAAPSRMTALECCTRLKLAKTSEIAKEVLEDQASSFVFKAVALAAIGKLGKPSDIEWLKSRTWSKALQKQVESAFLQLNSSK